MQRVKLTLVWLSWLCLAGVASAQTAVDTSSGSGIAAVQNYNGGGLLNGTYFDIRHMIGDGVGYQNSYSQIGAFTPIWLTENSFVAPNVRMIVTNSTQIGVNAGGVGRTYVDEWDRILGVYSYYDSDENSRNFRYNQVTVGAETLGQWWDLRANGYLQVGNNNNFVGAIGIDPNQSPFYVGNSIAFLGRQLRDQSLGGADIEIGTPVSQNLSWLRAYGGAYGYRTGDSNTIGFRGRMEATVSNDLTLGVQVTQDALFGTNVNGMIDFKFSGFQPTVYFPNMTTRQRMLNPVQRNWRVATRSYVQDVNVAAINPDTNKPYFITHVDNSTGTGGDGTFENPYHNLQSSPQADIILVHLGNAISAANPVTGSAVLVDNQRLLGDGVVSFTDLYAHYGNSTLSGTYQLPQSSNSNYAYVTNPLGDIVTLANNNEVAGLVLFNAAGSAITNTVNGSRNFNLHNLEITGNAGKGIALTNASGSGLISNINVGTLNHPNPLGLGNNAGGGIQISTGLPGLNLQFNNVFMNSDPVGSQAFGIALSANTGYLNANFDNVTANGNGQGIRVSEQSQLVNLAMNKVRANNNTGTGIQLDGVGGNVRIDMTDVAATGNGSDNLQIGSQAAPIVTSFVTVNLKDTDFSNSTGGSGIVFSQSGGGGSLYLFGGSDASTVTGNAVDGLGLFSTNSNSMAVAVHDGQFQNNGRDAFHIEGDNAANVDLFIDPTNASGSGRDAMFFSMNHDSSFQTTLLNNDFTNSGRSAIHGELQNTSFARIYSNFTSGSSSGGDGFYLNSSSGSLANVTIYNGSFANSGRLTAGSSAMNIVADNGRVSYVANFTPGNNRDPLTNALGTQDYGLSLNLSNGSLFSGAIQNGSLSDSLTNAINATVTSGANADLTLFNTGANNSGQSGFVANVDNATFTSSFVAGSNINGSGQNGVTATVTNGGQFGATFDNSSINNSGQDGVNATVTGATSIAVVDVHGGGTINNSGANGVNFSVDAGEFDLIAHSSSISNSGTVAGSGVLGVVTNGGLGYLELLNTAVDNNRDNGVFVTTNTGGNVQAIIGLGSVSGNGTSGITANHNDGIRLDLDASTNSLLQVYNGASVNGNGNDGVAILANNGTTNFQGIFANGFIVDNGVAGGATNAGANVSATNSSSVGLSFNGMTIGNSNYAGTQQTGFLSNTATNSQMFAGFTTTTLNNNTTNAVNSTVTTNATAEIDLINTIGSNSLGGGAVFNVNTAGQLLVLGSVNSGFISNGADGLTVNVDGAGSVASLGLDFFRLENNGNVFGGAGYNGIVTNGGNLNTAFSASTILANANQGIKLTATNPNSLISFNVASTDVNFNGSEGTLLNVTDSAVVNYRSMFSKYISNGSNGVFDGVSALALGNGPADTATIRTLFYNDTISGNTGNGLRLEALNGATMSTVVTDSAIVNNGGYGILGSANGVNTKFNLLMSGSNDLTGNTLGPIGPLTFSNIAQVGLVFSGTFDNSPADGLNVSISNVANALVAFQGPGTVNNSAQDGIDISLTNVNTGSVLINGISEVNNSGGDGIKVAFNNVANGALGIFGPTQIIGSGQSGVDISLVNSNMVQGLSFGGATVDILTPTDNLASPLGGGLPAPVTVTYNSLGVVPTEALVVKDMTISGSGSTGLSIDLQNSTVAANSSFLIGNTVVNSTGDGILINANSSTMDGMSIVGAVVNNNTGNGLNVVASNSSLQNFLVTSGNVTVASGVDLQITGFGNHTLTNTSIIPSVAITSFNMDLSTSVDNLIFNTVVGASTPFTPTNGTEITTGLTTVNGTAVPGFLPYPPDLIPDYSQLMNLAFNNFTPGKDFSWIIDYDLTQGGDESVPVTQLVGTTVTANFAGGGSLVGQLVLDPNDSSAVQFVATGQTVVNTASFSNNALDGVHFNLDNSDMSGLSVTNATINSNGSVGQPGHGINFTGGGGAVNNSTLNNVTIAGNTINGNFGDGVHLINPITTNSTLNINYTQNAITANTGVGVNMQLVSGTQTLNSNFTGNTISGNTGGAGVNIQLADNRNFTGNFAGNTISSNTAQGVNFGMGLNGVVNSNFTNNTISSNGSEGVNLTLKTGGQFNSSNFYGNTISNNGSLGVRLVVPNNASFNWNLGNTAQAANTFNANTDAGVGITMTGASTGTLNVAKSNFTNTVDGSDANFSGEGLKVTEAGSAILTGGITDSSFTGNAGDGALFTVTGNNVGIFAQLNNFTVNNSTFNQNQGDGLEFFRTADGEANNISVLNSRFNTNSGNGLVVRAANKFVTDTYTINSNTMSNNGQNGVLFDERADANILVNMDSNTIQNNAVDGILVSEQINSESDLRGINGVWTRNEITDNGRNGIWVNGRQAGLYIGDATNTALGNLIDSNGANGIRVSGRGTMSIGSNIITNNGTLNTLGTADETAGVYMDIRAANGESNITVVNNDIAFNLGDGIQWGIRKEYLSTQATVSIDGNRITNNDGRGIDVINRASNESHVNISNNFISANKLEGIYVVNTASASQDQFPSGTTTLAADGVLEYDPRLELRIVGNQVIGNGLASPMSGTGLVLRVGTSGGGARYGYDQTGGFASAGGAVPIGGSPFGLSSTFGGVVAVVDNNIFGGNFGNDIYFHSFVSTPTPAATQGNWTDTEFTVTSYQADPLSRLDLYFRNNTTDSGAYDFVGAEGAAAAPNQVSPYTTRDPSLVAFYNNAEGVFKSRLDNITAPNIPGPFNVDTRARNATRQAARIPGYNAPLVGPGLNFLYPGMGASTWRVSNDSLGYTDAGGNAYFPGGILDTSPYNDTFDADGRYLLGIGNNGEQPFGFGTF